MNFNLNKLNYTFTQKPILVGGKAIEYYGLRKAGSDIDLIALQDDVVALMKQYPNRIKDLWGDIGVCPFEFEIWRTICQFGYVELKEDAIEEKDFLVISLEKLLFMKAMGMKKEKYLQDTKLISEKLLNAQYENYSKKRVPIDALLAGIKNIVYLEQTGPLKK